MDPETVQILTEGEYLYELVQSKGWAIARQKMADKIFDLQNIHNLPEDGSTSIENVVVDIKARKAAVAIMYEWLKQIEGSAQKHITDRDMMSQTPLKEEEGYIERK